MDGITRVRTESVIHRLPGWMKMAGAVAIILFAALLPMRMGFWLWAPGLAVGTGCVLSRIPWEYLVRRLLLLEPLVLLVSAMALFGPGGWAFFGFLAARCTVSLGAMILLAYTTGFSEMLRVFRALRMPLLLVTTLALMHRYLLVLSEEAGRMRRARACRTFTSGRRFGWFLTTTVIGQLFVRASERAERIYGAMRARGWEESR